MHSTIQSGRSMIEMLGVLAIIGVLSAGGVAGYSSAMDSYKINKTIQMITDSAALNQTVFNKRTEGDTCDSISDADTLCDLGVIIGDVCNKGSGLYRTGYFGEKIQGVSWHCQTNYAGSDVSDTVVTSEGNIKILQPVTCFEIRFFAPIMSTASCAKIISNKSWENAKEIATAQNFGSEDKIFELPLSPAEAFTKCQEEVDADSGFFRVSICTSVAGFEAL